MRRQFAAGEILLREGDPSEEVVLVEAGRVEVLRTVGGDGILLGTAGPGEFIGEMGVLEGRARSATVRAVSEVTAELVAREAFLLRVSQEPALAHKLLLRMSVRLRHVEDLLAGLHAAAQTVAEASPADGWAIALSAVTYAAKFYVGVEPVAIERLPFTVGRAAGPDEAAPWHSHPHRARADGAVSRLRSGHERAGMERLKARRDATIARRLLAAQRRAPERRVRRRSRSWQVLADHCAEQWVLDQGSA